MAKILMINDEEDLLEVCRLSLETEGHEVEVLTDAEIALATAQRFRPDVIILDWVLADRNADEVVRVLRAEPRTRDIPVLMVSASYAAAEIANDLGVDGFLAKPFTIDVLLSSVARLVPAERQQLPREARRRTG